jgi:hypothetical protein
VTPTEFISSEEVLEALRLWHAREADVWPLAQLRLRTEIRDEQNLHGSLAGTGTPAQNRAILNRGLEMLRIISPEAEDLLRQRFEQRRDVLDVANRYNVSESALYYRQRQAIAQLTEIFNKLENSASSEWRERIISRLPIPSYVELVGIDEARQQLLDILLSPQAPFIVAIEGLGGLGKTALADRVTRDLVKTTCFDEIAWITAKQTHLSSFGRLQVESNRPALTFSMLIDELITQFDLPETDTTSHLQQQRLVKRYLREQTCLVVIDNLETLVDYRSLLPELRQWQSPSKFLLTSRFRLLGEPTIFSMPLAELSLQSALALIRLEAQRTGFATLATASEIELQQIYDTVGGNPLALKLIIGQLRFYSLPQVLAHFKSGRQVHSQEEIFDYIYLEIWENLPDDSKAVLLALTQAGETGFTFEHLTAVAGLDQNKVGTAIEELILLSLVDLGGTLSERRYRLHRLTERFLLSIFT